MTKKVYLFIAVIVVLTLSACSRSASTSTIATATQRVQGSNATPGTGTIATEDPMALVKLFATQTAMAGGTSSMATPTTAGGLVVPTVTPLGGSAGTPMVVSTTVPTMVVNPTAYPTPVKPATYTLQAGEYPYCIARRFNIDPDSLLTLNSLGENDLLQPGDVLNIPQTASPFPGARSMHTHPTTYVVALNDTIYRIGCYFGDVDPLAIAAVNHLAAPYTLTVGQSLNIP